MTDPDEVIVPGLAEGVERLFRPQPGPSVPRPARTTKSEAQLEKLFFDEVKKAGGMAVKLAPTHVGLPDRLVIKPGGALVLVELKTETGKLSPAQVVWHERAAALGCRVTVLYGEDDVRKWVAEL